MEWASDVLGCIATGTTVVAVAEEAHAAIGFHLDGLAEDGLSAPVPGSVVEYVEA